MKKPFLITLAVSAILAGSLAQAGNYPNSARTLTSGIGGGTQAARVPSSHPYTTRSQGYAYSGRSRNPAADISIDNFGAVHAAASPPAGSAYGGPVTSFPGQGTDHMNPIAAEQTTGKLPSFSSFPPSGGGNPGAGIPTSTPPVSTGAGMPGTIPPVSTGMPSTISPGSAPSTIPPVSTGIPPSVTPGTAPTTIPPVSTGGGMPNTIPPVSSGMPTPTPPALPAAASAMPPVAADASAAGLAKRGGGRP